MRRFRRTTLITAGCLAALAGLGLARKINFEPVFWSVLAVLPFTLRFRRKDLLSLYLVILLGLGLGLWRGSLYMHKLQQIRDLTTYTVTIQAIANTDAIYDAKQQLQFTASKIKLVEPYSTPLAGNFKISGYGVNMVYRGDRVHVSGKLFPTRGANQATMGYATIREIQPGTSWINSLTRRFTAGMQNAVPEPMASFGLGLLIGQRNTLPTNLTAQLTAVGLVHIVAVSGYNVTILARAAARLKLPSKYQQLILSLTLIGLFVLVTGFSASIVRAALVSGLSLWAWFYGRRIKPVLLIAFAAALTGLVNPFYVWSDLGWYLSFLAFFGVLVISPIIMARLFARQPKLLIIVLIETLSAEIMTLPLIISTFGQLSIVALLANVLIVPLVPWAMMLAAVAAAAGAVVPAIAGWIAWPATLLLTYMLDIIHLLASIPSVLLKVTAGSNLMVGFYASVLLAVLAARKHSKVNKSEPSL